MIKESDIDIKIAKEKFINLGYRIQKKERYVYESENHFIKIWVTNWTQSKSSRAGFDLGFYDKNNCSAFECFITDYSGDRGYITKKGECLKAKNKKDWKSLRNVVSKDTCKNFIKSIIDNAINSKGIHCDMFPSNIIIYKGNISLIDLDGYRSLSFLFEKEKSYFEEFDIDAWWKPHESALRDVNESIKSFLKSIFDIEINFKIDSFENLKRVQKIIEEKC